MLKPRQEALIKALVESFIHDAEPIASSFLVEKLREKLSPATVRNEMADLEHQGYIFQPHTSAGRVPTAKAYQYFVENYLDKDKALTNKEKELILEIISAKVEDREKLKNMAKAIADLSKQGVVVTFSECDSYYTGISNIFAQPEFHNIDLVVNLSAVIDKLESRIVKLLDPDRKEPEIYIGGKNPISEDCALIVFNFEIGKFKGIIGLLGPMRMDYQKSYTLIKESIKLLK